MYPCTQGYIQECNSALRILCKVDVGVAATLGQLLRLKFGFQFSTVNCTSHAMVSISFVEKGKLTNKNLILLQKLILKIFILSHSTSVLLDIFVSHYFLSGHTFDR